MRRLLLLPILCLLPLLASGQARYRVMSEGVPIGEAVVAQSLTPDRGKRLDIQLDVVWNGRKLIVRQLSVFNANGTPKMKSEEILVPATRDRWFVSAAFDGKQARVVSEGKKVNRILEVPLPKGASTAMPHEFWFIRDIPRVGTQFTTHRFNLAKRIWEPVEITYVEKISLSYRVAAHKVTVRLGDQFGTSFYDEQGMPIWIDDVKGFRLERMEPGR
jgi:hypothetical protein